MKRQGDKIRVMGGSGYKLSIAIVVVFAAALLILMLIVMPAVRQDNLSVNKKVVSIEYPQGAMGLGDDLNLLYVKVTYSDGTTAEVSFKDLMVSGLDIMEIGTQQVSFTYGDFHQVIPIQVKNTDCILRYQASTGGRVEGELTQSVATGGDGNTVIARPDIGYVFDSWEDGNPNMERRDFKVTESVIHTATFAKAKYIVVFRFPDLTVSKEEKVTYNESPAFVPVADDPRMQVYGYIFEGKWSLPFDHVTSDMTIDPIFRKYATDVIMEITKDANGSPLGKTDMPSVGYYPKDKEAKIVASPFVSRSFYSWEIKDYLGNWHEITVSDIDRGQGIIHLDIGSQGKTITFTGARVGDTVNFELYFTPESDTELIEIRANFVYDESTITFINSMNMNEGNIERRIVLKNGNVIGSNNIEPPAVLAPGYEFLGWFLEKGDTRVASSDKFTQPTVLVARWRKVFYSVTFNFDMGSFVEPRTVYVLYQSSLSSAVKDSSYDNPVPVHGIPLEVPSKQHYSFDGWYLMGEGGVMTSTVVDETYKVNGNIIVKAKFIPLTHDLYVDLIGSGRAERDVTTYIDGVPYTVTEPVPAGINKVQEISSYVYRFIAADGYCLEYINNNGSVNNYSNNNTWAAVQISYPSENRIVTASFVPKTYRVTVRNGVLGTAGTVSYLERSGGSNVLKETGAVNFTVSVEHNSAKSFTITPVITHYLYRVTVNGTVYDNFPKTTKTHTFNIGADKMVSDFVMIIEYLPYAYTVDLNTTASGELHEAEESSPGVYTPVAKSATYDFGSSPAFLFEANPKYYIKTVTVNGRKVDLYGGNSFSVKALYINGIAADIQSELMNDPRITSFVMVIDLIDDNYEISVEYAELYYNIKLSHTGMGTVTSPSATAKYGENVQIYAETGEGYYVYGYVLNGAETIFSDVLMSRPVNLSNITSDVNLVVNFSFKTHIITFSGSEFVSVTHGGDTAVIPETYGLANNMSGVYSLRAASGYYIDSVTVNGTSKVIPFNITSYDCHIDNILGNVEVAVTAKKILYTVNIKVNNSDYGKIKPEGPGAWLSSVSVSVYYGGGAIFDILATQGYRIAESSAYKVENGRLEIKNVTENKTITLEFVSIEYTISRSYPAHGTVSVQTKAKYGEVVTVTFTADAGYRLGSYSLGGPDIIPSSEYEVFVTEFTVTDNTVISAQFEAATVAGTVSVLIKETTAGAPAQNTVIFGGASAVTYLIAPPENYYISSVEVFFAAGGSMTVPAAAGKNRYLLDLSALYSSVEIVYEAVACTVTVSEDGSKGTTKVFVTNNGVETETTNARFYDTVRLEFHPAEGFEVAEVRLNGNLLAFDGSGAAFLCAAQAADVTVVYKQRECLFTGEVSSGEGWVNAASDIFFYGSGFIVGIVPRPGYELTAVRINAQPVSAAELLQIVNSMIYTVAAGSALSKGNILIQADFQPVNFWVNVTVNGAGTTDRGTRFQAVYGSTAAVTLRADDNNYIDAIEIDGVRIEVNSSNLKYYFINSVTQKYTEGVYSVNITKETYITVFFKKNVYNVTLLASANGITKVNLFAVSQGEGAQLDIKTVEHGRAVQINMEAAEGYNIARLFINNVEIIGFKNDNQNANNNRKLSYVYAGASGNGIDNNILIRVDYQTNQYSMGFSSVNDSPNFKAYDTVAASFGTISVNGYGLSGNYFTGIPHGSDFIINIHPVRERGYIITRIIITFTHPDLKRSVVYDASALVGTGTAVEQTGASIFFSALMAAQGLSYMACDISLIEVHFTKEAFTYSHHLESTAGTGSINTRFYHPNDSSKTYTVGSGDTSMITLIDGYKLEYGLGYNVFLDAAYGYSRSMFEVLSGGVRENKESAVRADAYTGILQSNTETFVAYKVNTFMLTFNYIVYSEFDIILDTPGLAYASISLIVGQTRYELSPGATSIVIPNCEYNSNIRMILTPNFAGMGYYISNFRVGSTRITAAVNSTDEYIYTGYSMPNNDVTAVAEFSIKKYNLQINYVGSDGLNSVANEALSSTPWGRDAVLRINTDAGYEIVGLLVTQNGTTTDRSGDIRYALSSETQLYRYILTLNSVKEDIVITAQYRRKEFEVRFRINDPNMGGVKMDITGDFYPKFYNVSPLYSDVSGGRAIIVFPASYYDVLSLYILPNEGFKAVSGITLRLYYYEDVGGVLVEKTLKDNLGNDYIRTIYGYYYNASSPDNLLIDLPYDYVSCNMELTFDFTPKGYFASVTKTPSSVNGTANCNVNVTMLANSGSYVDISRGMDGIAGNADDYYVNYFGKLVIRVDAVEGLSLSKIMINGGTVVNAYDITAAGNTRAFTQAGSRYQYTAPNGDTYSYTCIYNIYSYTLELTVNDTLLYDLFENSLKIEVQFKVNVYGISVSTYDNKTGQGTNNGNGINVTINVPSTIAHGNSLDISPSLKEGYTVSLIQINGLTINIPNKNSRYSESVNNLVSGIDVHDPLRSFVTVYYVTSIIYYSATIRAWVYEFGIDNYSDIAGVTTITPAMPHIIENAVEKYEYFTVITVEALARPAYNKIYRFSHFEEQYNNTWVRVQNGQRGITLYNDDQSGMRYTVNNLNGVEGNRTFRVVYYRVLTVTVSVMPEYKYADGSYTPNNTLRYLPYLTAAAMVGENYLTDINAENAQIYADASANGKVPYVKKYTYHVDSGNSLRLFYTDHVEKNTSSDIGFYYIDSGIYRKLSAVSSVGVSINTDRDFYLVARNETLLSYSIETLENESNTVGGSLAWKVIQYNTLAESQGVTYRGSMNTAKVLDRVEITVSTTANYRFTGLYLKNVDEAATKALGYLVFRDESSAGMAWTLIEANTSEYITVTNYGNTVRYTIFVTGNMQMKFQFYRTFKVTYAVDYQGVGAGPGTITRIDAESQTPFFVPADKSYETHDYYSFLTLSTPVTSENYQFVGWFVNGVNLYRYLDTEYPSDYKRVFRFYQNSVDKGIGDGLDLRVGGVDTYEIKIVAMYEPIIVVAMIDEFFFFDEKDNHWNSWQSTSYLKANVFEYYTNKQVLNGLSSTGRYAVPLTPSTIGFEAWAPSNFKTAMDTPVEDYRFNSYFYNAPYNSKMLWSMLADLYANNPAAGLNLKEVYSNTSYLRMMLKQQGNMSAEYDVWKDNILTLTAKPLSGVDLVEWEYFKWSSATTGKFVPIEYVSEAVDNGGGAYDYNNKASMDTYYINFTEYAKQMGNNIDWSRPFIIRPKFQKKVTLELTRKAYNDFYGDATTAGNNMQNPTIVDSTGTNVRAQFNYNETAKIVPYAGANYRFIDWYFGEDPTAGLLNTEMINPGGGQTLAWLVPLRFNYGEDEQNTVRLQGRYIRQYITTIVSSNIAGGALLLNDAPKVYLSSNPTSSDYDYKFTSAVADGWNLAITADAGLKLSIGFDRRDVGVDAGHLVSSGDGTYKSGYNRIYDFESGVTGLLENDIRTAISDSDIISDPREAGKKGETKALLLNSGRDRTIKLSYESFGTLTFTNLGKASSIQLGKAISTNLRSRWPSYFPGNGSEPIILRDYENYNSADSITGSNSDVDGIIVLRRIPIRNINYTTGGASSEGYNVVPCGFAAGNYIQVDPGKIGVSTNPADPRGLSIMNAAFNASSSNVTKNITLNYNEYNLFEIAYNPQPYASTDASRRIPGSTYNPYLIKSRGGISAASILRNIDIFYYWNSTVKGINFKIAEDITLTTGGQGRNAWVPACWSSVKYPNGNSLAGFDGVIDGDNYRISGFNISSTTAKTTGASDTSTTTRYSYAAYGYGLFASIRSDAEVKNIVFSSVNFSELTDFGVTVAGILAAKISGTNILIEKVIYENTPSISGISSYVGFIAGNINGTNLDEVKIKNITLNSGILLPAATTYFGVIAGSASGALFENIRIAAGTFSFSGRGNAGVLVGNMTKSRMYNCGISGGNFTIGNTSNGDGVGGLIGTASESEITSCFITSAITVNASASGSAGGIVGVFNSGTITAITMQAAGLITITIRGANIGLVAGINSGIISNTELSPSNVMLRAATYVGANLNVGAIAGINSDAGLITDCGVYNSSTAINGVNKSYNTTNAIIYAFSVVGTTGTVTSPAMQGENLPNGWESLIRSSTSPYTTNAGGIAGNNAGKVFNSYMVGSKIVVLNNTAGVFTTNLGGIVGYNVNALLTNMRGVSSCFTRGNSLLVSNLLRAANIADEPSQKSYMSSVGIGGIAGANGKVENMMNAAIRNCYAVNNYTNMYSQSFGKSFEKYQRVSIFSQANRVITTEYSVISLFVGGIVGGIYTFGETVNNYSYAERCWVAGDIGSSDNLLVGGWKEYDCQSSTAATGPAGVASVSNDLIKYGYPGVMYNEDAQLSDDTIASAGNHNRRAVVVEFRSGSIAEIQQSCRTDAPVSYGAFLARDNLEKYEYTYLLRTAANGDLALAGGNISFNWSNNLWNGSLEMIHILDESKGYIVKRQLSYGNANIY